MSGETNITFDVWLGLATPMIENSKGEALGNHQASGAIGPTIRSARRASIRATEHERQ